MHPLDLTVSQPVNWQPTPDSNVTIAVCVGAYQGSVLPYPGVDLIMGPSFFRNVYLSYVLDVDSSVISCTQLTLHAAPDSTSVTIRTAP